MDCGRDGSSSSSSSGRRPPCGNDAPPGLSPSSVRIVITALEGDTTGAADRIRKRRERTPGNVVQLPPRLGGLAAVATTTTLADAP